MEELQAPLLPPLSLPKPNSSRVVTFNTSANGNLGQVFGFSTAKKRGHGSRSWIHIDPNGNSKVLELDKGTLMRNCSLPARDLRLLDPMFIYPSTILGREKAIVVNLEQIRCIITSDEVILMNSLDSCVMHYESELCKRLRMNRDQNGTCCDLSITNKSLKGFQVNELQMEIYPVLDELASSISTLNLERVRRFKGHLLALNRRVQKVRDEIEHLMDDDGDMAEMYLTEKKERMEAYMETNHYAQSMSSGSGFVSKSAPVSPVSSTAGHHKLERTQSSLLPSSRHGSITSSSNNGYNIEKLEMLLEAYFVVIDNTLSKLLSLKEYIDDTEDLINIKLGNVQNQLIQFELLLTAATFVAAIFTVVAGIFGMNFTSSVFDYSPTFHWVVSITGIGCAILYMCFLSYFRHKRILPF